MPRKQEFTHEKFEASVTGQIDGEVEKVRRLEFPKQGRPKIAEHQTKQKRIKRAPIGVYKTVPMGETRAPDLEVGNSIGVEFIAMRPGSQETRCRDKQP